jgi:hypothetical protein
VSRRVPLRAAAIVAAAVPVHVALALATDLSPDEAYYLCAARRGVGIVDHPPLLLWMLRGSDRLLGWAPVELRVRIWAVLLSAALGIACVVLARRRGAGERGAELGAWVGVWGVLAMAGGFVSTPDGAAMVAVAVALATVGDGSVVAAGALGLGMLAKVVIAPIAGLLALGMTQARQSRRAAMAVGAAPWLALPWVWPSLRFQLRHAFAQTGAGGWTVGGAAGALIAAVGAQVLLWSPAVIWIGARELGRSPVGDRAVVLGMSGLVLISAVVRAVPPEPNWWAPAAIVVIAAFARGAEKLGSKARAAIVASVVVPTLVAAAHAAVPFLPLGEKVDPAARLHGWSHGREPVEAPGVGEYGAAAERCVYKADCGEINSYFDKMDAHE